MKRTLYLLVILSVFGIPGALFSQQGTVAAEGNATGFTGSVSYSFGQAVYTSQFSPDGNVNQGIQQPFDVLMVSTSKIGDAFTTSVYPNPATTSIHLQIDPVVNGNYKLSELSYSLTDISGRHIKENNVISTSTMIPVDGLTEAIYFLNIQYRHENIKTFKIVKTNQQ